MKELMKFEGKGLLKESNTYLWHDYGENQWTFGIKQVLEWFLEGEKSKGWNISGD